ncbi:hypothetical protein VTI74DRAFT_4709 [Chaetomium olivicolor]
MEREGKERKTARWEKQEPFLSCFMKEGKENIHICKRGGPGGAGRRYWAGVFLLIITSLLLHTISPFTPLFSCFPLVHLGFVLLVFLRVGGFLPGAWDLHSKRMGGLVFFLCLISSLLSCSHTNAQTYRHIPQRVRGKAKAKARVGLFSTSLLFAWSVAGRGCGSCIMYGHVWYGRPGVAEVVNRTRYP